MNLNEIVTAEDIIQKILKKNPSKDIFPITLIKYLLNKNSIIDFFNNSNNYTRSTEIDIDSNKCNICINNTRKLLCRKHTSIYRILNINDFFSSNFNEHNVCMDDETNIFMFMNEIFKLNNNKLYIVYAPHPKLIQGNLTENKIKKISYISTVIDNKNILDKINNLKYSVFSSTKIMELTIKTWFNKELSLITYLDNKKYSYCLITNR